MTLWNTADQANNAPKYTVVGVGGVVANGSNAYANVTVSSFTGNVAAGLFGVSQAEAVAAGKGVSPGWVVRRAGTGGVSTVTINNGGSNYGNLGVGMFSNGSVNATFTCTTNSTGGITNVTMLSPGAGWVSAGDVVFTRPANAIVGITVNDGGTGYVNGEAIVFSNGVVNATGTITTNSTGGITNVSFTLGGRGFSNTLNTVIAITSANGASANIDPTIRAGGTTANITANLGGRAGRVLTETLVFAKMTGNNSILP